MSRSTTELATPNTGSIGLIIEGGGVRDVYSAAVVFTLLEAGIYFPKVYGISAGAELAIDYGAQASTRASSFFQTLVCDSKAGGVGSFLRGTGFFNTNYIYGSGSEAVETPDSASPSPLSEGSLADISDAESLAVQKHPALRLGFKRFYSSLIDVHIEAFSLEDGTTKAWDKANLPTARRVQEAVAASCAYPLVTPKVVIDGVSYIDGGMGTSAGICLDTALQDGFERVFVIRSQERPYRMAPMNLAKKALYKATYGTHPHTYEALLSRPARYNAILDRLDKMEALGQAYVFCPNSMPISYKTTDPARIQSAYDLARRQCVQELDRWIDWIFER